MTIFISGGCKNGKSSIAEDICTSLAGSGPLYYVATMQAFEDEDRARIKRHVQQRDGKGFVTIEQPRNIIEILKKTDAGNSTFLLDSVTALMINELYSADPRSAKDVASELTRLCAEAGNIIFVSDYIYMEKDNYSQYTLDYLKALSYVDKALAKACDAVCEVHFGNIEIYKGELPL